MGVLARPSAAHTNREARHDVGHTILAGPVTITLS